MVPIYGGRAVHVYCGVVREGWLWLWLWVVCELFLPYKAFVTLTRRNATTELGSLRVTPGTGYPTE